jgi:PadR family transcriptional regulator PadR
MSDKAELLPGTLDLLILKAVSLGPLHGYGVLLRIGQISGQTLLIEQGALYPALFRLVRQGLLTAEWDKSDNNRRAKYYELTRKGRKRLQEETEWWNRVVAAVATVLAAEPEHI